MVALMAINQYYLVDMYFVTRSLFLTNYDCALILILFYGIFTSSHEHAEACEIVNIRQFQLGFELR